MLRLAIPASTGVPVFFFCQFSKLLSSLFLGENIPTFHVHMVLFPSFHKAFHGAPFPRELSPLPICQCFSFLPSENRCNISGKNCPYEGVLSQSAAPSGEPSVQSRLALSTRNCCHGMSDPPNSPPIPGAARANIPAHGSAPRRVGPCRR